MSTKLKFTAVIIAALLCLAGCSSYSVFEEKDGGPDRHVNLASIPDATPKHEPRSRYGNPATYVVHGKRYYTMTSADGFSERGIWDIANVTGFYNMTNRVASASDMQPNPEYHGRFR